MTQADLSHILPELILAIWSMVALLWAAFSSRDALAPALSWMTAGLMAALAVMVAMRVGEPDATAFGGLLAVDDYAAFAKVLILLAAAAALLIGVDYMRRRDLLRFEFPALVALSVTGMMVMVGSADLMSLYMGLELQSLPLYVMAAMRRDGKRSTEAGLKYFVLGALSSGLLLYGASLAYGYAGTTSFAGIADAARAASVSGSAGLLVGMVFIVAGMAFKVSAAPFHMWTPDVYEGAPTPVTAFFATAPKVAALAMFARVAFDAFGPATGDWTQVVVALSALSMFVGSIAAIGQRDIKRLMAYSSIAHMGYALIGLAAGTAEGVEAMLVYLAIYAIMNVGAFSFVLMMHKDGGPVTTVDALAGHASREPGRALALLVLLFSLAGVPPMLGFFAKLRVWQAGVEAGLVWLVVASAIASAIGAYYYLRIVYLMYFGEESDELDGGGGTLFPQAALYVSALAMLIGAISLAGMDSAAMAAAAGLVD